MGTIFDNLYDVLFQPRVGMKNIGKDKPVFQALSVFLGSILLPMCALCVSIKATELSSMMYLLMILKVMGALLLWILSAAIWQLAAEFFGGQGTAAGLFTTLGFTRIPYIFIVPLWAVINLMPATSKTVFLCLSLILVIGWSLYLDLLAIKEVHELPMAKAVLVMLTPILVMGLLCAVTAVFISSVMITMSM